MSAGAGPEARSRWRGQQNPANREWATSGRWRARERVENRVGTTHPHVRESHGNGETPSLRLRRAPLG